MFLWVRLVLDSLPSLNCVSDLEAAVDDLPSGLYQAYVVEPMGKRFPIDC